jgi:hypothetical protein
MSQPTEPNEDEFLFMEGEDPVGRMGYGILSYFQLVFALLFIAFTIFLLHIPVMTYYRSWHGLEHDHTSIFGV